MKVALIAAGPRIALFDTPDRAHAWDERLLADASLYWVAAETGVASVLTADVKDFARYRLPDGRAFELL